MTDRRATVPEETEADVRPSVAQQRRTIPGWALVVMAIVAGATLFTILETRRRNASAPAVRPRIADTNGPGTPLPALYIPPEIVPVAAPAPVAPPSPAPAPPPPPPLPPAPQIVYVPQPAPQPVAAPPPAVPNSPALVVDSGVARSGDPQDGNPPVAGPGPPQGPGAAIASNTRRVQAGGFANRATTVTQGTLIPAVLESAFDSSRPGFARAIVSRDVRGFDGSRILIPRGSRLIGEYQSAVQRGQKRALILWTRLIRPDGATIAIGSPAADTLGGTGLKARVNTHFFERFGEAILQSALDVGVNLASRSVDSSVIVALPGLRPAVPVGPGQQITPTLKVRQGTSISVFVARDLDFTAVEKK